MAKKNTENTVLLERKEKKQVNATAQLDNLIERVNSAQKQFAGFSQEKVDRIFYEAAMAANHSRIPLAKMAAAETKMGVLEDKIIKNHFASEFIYNKFRDARTCGVIEQDEAGGYSRIAEPVGVIAGVVPTTNPTSTTIFKTLAALKTRNAIIFSPHPRAKDCTIEAAKIILDAAVKAGAPEDIIAWIEKPSIELSQYLMKHDKVAIILATGGPGMVKAAYSSGKPAIGVGSGNTPAVIDETADIKMAVNSILHSKTFDNGLICASEQSIVVCEKVYDKVRDELETRGAYLLGDREKQQLRNTIVKDGKLNAKIVGQPAYKIARMAGFHVPEDTKVLIGEIEGVGEQEVLSIEKLSPILGMYKRKDFDTAVETAAELVEFAGMGHTGVLYTDQANTERIDYFSNRIKAGRVLVNMPSSQGAIGDVYNFRLEPSLTLGCGSWGGNSVSENVGVKHLLNIKTVARRRENMLWFRVPEKIYFKFGSLPEAFSELKNKKRAFIVTDKPLFDLGYADKITDLLQNVGVDAEVFYDVKPDPDLATVNKGLERINQFQPDVILALGGGSPIDAAKVMWLMYEQPDLEFDDLAMRFMDIRKRICEFPETGKKATMIAVPTTSGTGSEVTPFAVITDEQKGVKYPIADYQLTPDMAIIDPELVLSMPAGLTAASGMDAVTHAIEALTATTATEYTNGLALESLRLLFEYLPASYKEGGDNRLAREKVHYAATMAGMAFANAFLGLCHSMAHKLGSEFHIPHGVANGILITEIIRYNANDKPPKMGTFSQYRYPQAKERYGRIANYLDLGGNNLDEKTENLIKAVEQLRDELDLPATVEQAGVKRTDFFDKIDELAEKAFDDQCTGNNPRYPLISEIRGLYEKAFGVKKAAQKKVA